MSDPIPTPLPPGMVDELDPGRLDALALEIVLAQQHETRDELLAILNDGATAVVEGFDEDGFSRFGLEHHSQPTVVQLGRVHWTALHPRAEGTELRPRPIV